MKKPFRGKWGLVVGAALALAVITLAFTIHAEPASPATPPAGTMSGFELVAERQTSWQLRDGWCDVPGQVWRHTASGAMVDIIHTTFDSPEAALAACEAEAAATQLASQPGTFSGAKIGELAWRWPVTEVAARLMIRRGCEVVSVHISGKPLPRDTAALLEGLAKATLAGTVR